MMSKLLNGVSDKLDAYAVRTSLRSDTGRAVLDRAGDLAREYDACNDKFCIVCFPAE